MRKSKIEEQLNGNIFIENKRLLYLNAQFIL